jgi:putative redox protein
MKISTTYQGQLRFADGEGPAQVVMDAAAAKGGRGEALSPKQLVLQGLAGCTGLDVVSILGKKEVAFESLTIEVEAEQNKLHPVVFKEIAITFRFVGDPADREHFERAVELSETRFCGVTAMLGKTAEITTTVEIEPAG